MLGTASKLNQLTCHTRLPALSQTLLGALPRTLADDKSSLTLPFAAVLLSLDDWLGTQGVHPSSLLAPFALSCEALLIFQPVLAAVEHRSLTLTQQRQLLYTLNRLVTAASGFAVSGKNFHLNVLFQRMVSQLVAYHCALRDHDTQAARPLECEVKMRMYCELMASEGMVPQKTLDTGLELMLRFEPELVGHYLSLPPLNAALRKLKRSYSL